MRILQICSARDIGGGERHVADLANSLATRGHEVFAAVDPGAPLIGELRLAEGNVFEVRIRGPADVTAAAKIAGIVRENKIDIIHAHVARDYPLAALVSQHSARAPFVLTRHVLFPMKRIHRLLLRRVSRVIAVSNAVAGVLEKQAVFPPEKIVTIYNGVDMARFASNGSGDSYDTSLRNQVPDIVGIVGHLAPIKGQDIFVRAAAIVARERDDVDFVIAGEDKSPTGEHRAALEKLVEDLGLERRVRFLGWRDDVAQVLKGLDIFVSAARSEPFGLAIVEAMASGVPVIATASEGALEIIHNGVTGRLVQTDDVDTLAKEIMSLLADRPEQERLRANALSAVTERFSLERMVTSTERVYEDTITRN